MARDKKASKKPDTYVQDPTFSSVIKFAKENLPSAYILPTPAFLNPILRESRLAKFHDVAFMLVPPYSVPCQLDEGDELINVYYCFLCKQHKSCHTRNSATFKLHNFVSHLRCHLNDVQKPDAEENEVLPTDLAPLKHKFPGRHSEETEESVLEDYEGSDHTITSAPEAVSEINELSEEVIEKTIYKPDEMRASFKTLLDSVSSDSSHLLAKYFAVNYRNIASLSFDRWATTDSVNGSIGVLHTLDSSIVINFVKDTILSSDAATSSLRLATQLLSDNSVTLLSVTSPLGSTLLSALDDSSVLQVPCLINSLNNALKDIISEDFVNGLFQSYPELANHFDPTRWSTISDSFSYLGALDPQYYLNHDDIHRFHIASGITNHAIEMLDNVHLTMAEAFVIFVQYLRKLWSMKSIALLSRIIWRYQKEFSPDYLYEFCVFFNPGIRDFSGMFRSGKHRSDQNALSPIFDMNAIDYKFMHLVNRLNLLGSTTYSTTMLLDVYKGTDFYDLPSLSLKLGNDLRSLSVAGPLLIDTTLSLANSLLARVLKGLLSIRPTQSATTCALQRAQSLYETHGFESPLEELKEQLIYEQFTEAPCTASLASQIPQADLFSSNTYYPNYASLQQWRTANLDEVNSKNILDHPVAYLSLDRKQANPVHFDASGSTLSESKLRRNKDYDYLKSKLAPCDTNDEFTDSEMKRLRTFFDFIVKR